MLKTTAITGETLKKYIQNLNDFWNKNKNIEVINIKHFITNYDDYTAIITVKE